MNSEEILNNDNVVLAYWTVVLVLVLLAVWYVRCLCNNSENFKASSYSAGATMRIADSKFSTVTTPNNDNL
jgi:hypothetical protein